MAGLIPFNRRRNNWLDNGFDDFRNWVDDFFTEGWPFGKSFADSFKLDVQENDKEYIVEAELPGVNKDQLSLSFYDGRLEIAANKEESTEDKGKNYLHRERSSVSMRRSVYLPDADEDNVKAKLQDGVLRISILKKGNPKKSINID
jgi:HSP20 family protein